MNKFKRTAIWTIVLAFGIKLSGLVRESVIARDFGASAETTGYYLAFSFITLILAMVTTGFNNVFLPLYIKERNANRFSSDRNTNGMLNSFTLLFIIIGILGFYFSPKLVPLIFFSMSNEVEIFAVGISKLYFLFMAVIVLSALLDSFLQSKRIFVPSQLSKLLATLLAAIFGLLFSDVWGIYSVVYGFIVGTILGTIIQAYYLVKSDYRWKPELKVEKEFSKMFIVLLIPALLNSAVGQVNLFVNKAFAAGTFDEAVTYLNNASMIISIPNAIYATTIVAIIFTLLSEQAGNKKEFNKTFFRGMEMSVLLLLPITLGIVILGDELVSFIYERGKFTKEDSYGTYLALLWYSPVIVFQGMQLILSKSMYAQGKTATVFKISLTTIFLNLLLNWFLVDRYGYLALAFSTSIVSLYFFVISMIVVYKDLNITENKRLYSTVWRIVIIALLMGISMFGMDYILGVFSVNSIIQLILITFLGSLSYLALLKWIYPTGFSNILSLVRKKK